MMVAFKETLGDADLFTHTLKPNHSARHGWKRYHFMLFYSLPKEINPVRVTVAQHLLLITSRTLPSRFPRPSARDN